MKSLFPNLLVSGWKNVDLKVLLWALGVVGGVWIVAELANAVAGGRTMGVDEQILRAFRNSRDLSDPIGPRWVESSMRDITALGSSVVLVAIGVVFTGFLLLRRDFLDVLLLALTFSGGSLVNYSLKSFFARPRPSLVPHLDYVSNPSFPSGHALLSIMVYCTIGALLANLVQERRMKLYILSVALFLSFSIGVSRVYLGVHFPSDVLAGWTIGLLWAVSCWMLARGLRLKNPTTRPAAARR